MSQDPGVLGAAWQAVGDEFAVLREQGTPSLGGLAYRGMQAMANAGPAITPSMDATGRTAPVSAPAGEAQIVGANEQVIPPQALPQQGVLPTPAQPGVTQVSPGSYYRRAYGR